MINNPSLILIEIWQRANIRDKELLEKITSLNEHADLIASNASLVSGALGSLIETDKLSGVFNDKSNVSQLLYHLSSQFEIIRALSFIGDEAKYLLDSQVENAQ